MVKNRKITISLNLLVVTFFVYDLVEDYLSRDMGIEFFIEIILFGMIVALLFYEMDAFYRVKTEYMKEKGRVSRLSGELHAYIDTEFNRWSLTQSEREVAWFLIRGYTFGEIAEARSTKEKTVRQQATAIYAKSETRNKGEFISLFLEDLLATSHLKQAENSEAKKKSAAPENQNGT
jgi:DNA-binding CsgD family transcriptional regulator